MEKWKKAILNSIYKQWMSGKNEVSAVDILRYLSNQDNHFEIYQYLLDKVTKNPFYRIKFFLEGMF